MLFPTCDRVCPQWDTAGPPEVNRDEPEGCVYVFHVMFFSVFVHRSKAFSAAQSRHQFGKVFWRKPRFGEMQPQK
jgi:hypothetical protein